MHKIYSTIVGCFLTCSVVSLAMAQEDMNIDTILQQFPARDMAHQTHLVDQLIQLGPDAIVTLGLGLKNMGTGDDNQQRLALSALAKAKKSPDELVTVETGFGQALREEIPIDGQMFLIEQLQSFGTDASIEVFQDKVKLLCEPSVHAIRQIRSSHSLDALLETYEEIDGYCRQAVVKSLADYNDPKALSLLKQIVTSGPASNSLTYDLALDGLIKHGDKSLIPILEGMLAENPTRAKALMIQLANVQWEKGLTTHQAEIAEIILDNSPTIAERTAMYQILCESHRGHTLLPQDFRRTSEDEALAMSTALEYCAEIPLDPYVDQIQRISPAAQVQMLQAIADRKFIPAIPEVNELLKSHDEEVQMAAIRALSTLEGEQCLATLRPFVTGNKPPHVVKAAAEESMRWIDSSQVFTLEKMYEESAVTGKVALLGLIGHRHWSELWTTVKSGLDDENADVRTAAYDILPRVSAGVPIRELTTVAPIVQSEHELEQLRYALQAKSRTVSSPDSIAIPLVETFGKSGRKLLEEILPGIGGRAGLEYIQEGDNLKPLMAWSTPEAIHTLMPLVETEGSEAYSEIMRLMRHPELTCEQRVLHLRKLMEIVESEQAQKDVLSAFRMSKCYGAFRYVTPYLKDSIMQMTAAESLVSIVLPPSGEQYGLTGVEVKEALMQADTILRESDNEYGNAFLDNYLSVMPLTGDFEALFNGQDLEGWQGLVGNPITRDTMYPIDLQRAQMEANGKVNESWKVEDGKILFFGDGFDNLCTEREFRDFELLIDWKIEKDGDSGLYLRGSPQVQIWDPYREDDTIGSGGLFNNEKHASEPLILADNPVGEWNNFRIIMIDDRVTVYLNGQLVTDHVVLENFWDRSLPIFREGHIELQAHTTPLQFRDIYIREIEVGPDLNEREINEGYVSLFDGVSLAGWVGNKVDYVVENGEIAIYPGLGGSGGNLYTEKEYSDFILKFDFQLTPGANNGLGIHAPLEGDAAYLGKEIQILDNSAEKYANLKEYQYHGSVYGLIPADRGALNPPGEWNSMEVSVRSNRIGVTVNGTRILYDDINRATENDTLDGKEHPGIQRTNGHIGFLGHGSEVHFKNIRILDMSEGTIE